MQANFYYFINQILEQNNIQFFSEKNQDESIKTFYNILKQVLLHYKDKIMADVNFTFKNSCYNIIQSEDGKILRYSSNKSYIRITKHNCVELIIQYPNSGSIVEYVYNCLKFETKDCLYTLKFNYKFLDRNFLFDNELTNKTCEEVFEFASNMDNHIKDYSNWCDIDDLYTIELNHITKESAFSEEFHKIDLDYDCDGLSGIFNAITLVDKYANEHNENTKTKHYR